MLPTKTFQFSIKSELNNYLFGAHLNFIFKTAVIIFSFDESDNN